MEKPITRRELIGEYCPVSRQKQNVVVTFKGSFPDFERLSFTCNNDGCQSKDQSCPIFSGSGP